MKNISLLILILFITACAQITMTGKQYPPVDVLDVKVLFKDKPSCQYEELGFITTPLRRNQNVAIQDARETAASIGADYLLIEAVNRNAFNDTAVSAIAYKCAKVNRKKVELKPQ